MNVQWYRFGECVIFFVEFILFDGRVDVVDFGFIRGYLVFFFLVFGQFFYIIILGKKVQDIDKVYLFFVLLGFDLKSESTQNYSFFFFVDIIWREYGFLIR